MQPSKQERLGARTSLQFDYQGKRVRTAAAAATAPVKSERRLPAAQPEDQGSAIKEAIIRWLNEK